jgi:hypothetical protein
MPASRRQVLAARRRALVAHGDSLRRQLQQDAARVRRGLDMTGHLLRFLPILRPLFARLWRHRRRPAGASFPSSPP